MQLLVFLLVLLCSAPAMAFSSADLGVGPRSAGPMGMGDPTDQFDGKNPREGQRGDGCYSCRETARTYGTVRGWSLGGGLAVTGPNGTAGWTSLQTETRTYQGTRLDGSPCGCDGRGISSERGSDE